MVQLHIHTDANALKHNIVERYLPRTMWTAVLNTLCICLPVIAFASPATLFIPLFCPAVLSRLKKNENAFSFYDYEANYDVDVDTSTLIEMSPLPLTTQMVSCYLFAIYAYHFEMWALLIPNSVGFVLGLFFASFYPLKVATKSLMRQWEIQYGLSVCIMVMGATTIHNIPYLSSSIAAVIGFIMCSYPLVRDMFHSDLISHYFLSLLNA